MYRWLQITLTNQTKIDFPWISFIHLHFFCFPSYYFYMGKFTLDNSNHALSIWKVQKKFAAVRNIVFILTTKYSLSLLFCQSSFKTESSTVYLYQALKCACCLYSFPTPLSGYICHDLLLTQTFFDYHDLPLTQTFFDYKRLFDWL